jgi:uncharacterized protein (TIGR02246 family)
MHIRLLSAASVAALLALPLIAEAHEAAQVGPAAKAVSPAARPAVEVVDRFSAALQSGDLKLVGQLLSDDVLVLESGGAERSRKEYLAGHAPHDAAFMKDARVRIVHRTARADGRSVWVGTESEVTVPDKDGQVKTLLSTETMILHQFPEGWRIVHIHWSSRPKEP